MFYLLPRAMSSTDDEAEVVVVVEEAEDSSAVEDEQSTSEEAGAVSGDDEDDSNDGCERVDFAEAVLKLADLLPRRALSAVMDELDAVCWDDDDLMPAVAQDETVRSKLVDLARTLRCAFVGAAEAARQQLMSEHRARLVCSVTMDDGAGLVRVKPGGRRVKLWKVVNVGATRWPAVCHLVQVGGVACEAPVPRRLPCPEARPDETAEVAAMVVAPDSCGTYSTEWMLVDGEGRPMLEDVLVWVFQVTSGDDEEDGGDDGKAAAAEETPPEKRCCAIAFDQLVSAKSYSRASAEIKRRQELQQKKQQEEEEARRKAEEAQQKQAAQQQEIGDISKLTENERALVEAGVTHIATVRALLAQNNGSAKQVLARAQL